jgi:hypothetical protein
MREITAAFEKDEVESHGERFNERRTQLLGSLDISP